MGSGEIEFGYLEELSMLLAISSIWANGSFSIVLLLSLSAKAADGVVTIAAINPQKDDFKTNRRSCCCCCCKDNVDNCGGGDVEDVDDDGSKNDNVSVEVVVVVVVFVLVLVDTFVMHQAHDESHPNAASSSKRMKSLSRIIVV